MPRRRVFDRWLFLTAGLLLVGGLFMVASASHYIAVSRGLSPYHFLVRQGLHAAIGVLLLWGLIRTPYARLARPSVVSACVVASAAALLLVLAMPASGGAHRWIRLGPVGVQPSEFAKLAVILFTASFLSRKEKQVNDLWAVPLPCLALVGLLGFLVAIEPDLGSAVMLGLTAAVLLFIAGLCWSWIAGAAAASAALFVLAVLLEPYRLRRVAVFLNPEADLHGAGFQLAQSLIAIGSGGLTGVGLGEGQQKAFYLPAAHTDFVFSVVGEELGLAGTGVLFAAFMLLFWRGMRTAIRAPDRFGFYLASGITTLMTLQAYTHMGVCLGLFPTKGLPLPFVSYGGSSLLFTMAALGVLLNVSQQAD